MGGHDPNYHFSVKITLGHLTNRFGRQRKKGKMLSYFFGGDRTFHGSKSDCGYIYTRAPICLAKISNK